ncbi:hypothetical protein EDB87DRAFT_1617300 [Lactarius vividus]|nr:hypothetical protein EDB87DRAFT_1617300 [Lactarius vividus]
MRPQFRLQMISLYNDFSSFSSPITSHFGPYPWSYERPSPFATSVTSGTMTFRECGTPTPKLWLQNPSELSSTKSGLGSFPGSDSKPFLTIADKSTQKRPRPRTLQPIFTVFAWTCSTTAFRQSNVPDVFLLTLFAGESTGNRICDGLLRLDPTAHPVAPVVLIIYPALVWLKFISSLLFITSLIGMLLIVVVYLPYTSSFSFVHPIISVGYGLCAVQMGSIRKSSRHGISGTLSVRRWCCLVVVGGSEPLHSAAASGMSCPFRARRARVDLRGIHNEFLPVPLHLAC